MSKFDFSVFMKSFLGGCKNLIINNQTTIIGGISLIAFSLICKHLDIPVQVSNSFGTGKITFNVNGQNDSEDNSNVIVLNSLSDDSVKTAIDAIVSTSNRMWYDSDRLEAAKNIYKVITNNRYSVSDETVSYAITKLNNICSKCAFSSTEKQIINYISKLATGT